MGLRVDNGGQQCYQHRTFRIYGVKHTVPYILQVIGDRVHYIPQVCPVVVFLAKEFSCTHIHYAFILYHYVTNNLETWFIRIMVVYISYYSEIWAGSVALTHLCIMVSEAISWLTQWLEARKAEPGHLSLPSCGWCDFPCGLFSMVPRRCTSCSSGVKKKCSQRPLRVSTECVHIS